MRKLRHRTKSFAQFTVRKWWNCELNLAAAKVFKGDCAWLVQGPKSLVRPTLESGRNIVGHDVQAVGGGHVMWGLVRSLDFLPSTMGSHRKVWRRSVKTSLAVKQGEQAPGASDPAEVC